MSPVRLRINLAAFCSDLAGFLGIAAVFLRLPEITGSQAGGSESDLNGIVQALAAGGYAVLALRVGRWSDRLSWTASCRIGALASAAFAFLAARSDTVLGLAGFAIANRAALSLYWPALQGGLGDLAPDRDRTRWVASLNFSWSIGKATGFLAAGAIDEWAGTQTALAVAGGISILSAFLVPSVVAAGPGRARVAAKSDARRFLRVAWLGNFLAFGLAGILASQLPVLGRSHGESPLVIESQLFLLFFSQTLMFLLLGRWHAWQDRGWPFLAGGAFLVLATPLIPRVASAAGRAPLLVVIGCVFGFAYQASLTYSLRTAGARGAGAGMHEGILGLGACALPLLAGKAALSWGGAPGAFYFAAAAGAVVVAGQGLLLRGSR